MSRKTAIIVISIAALLLILGLVFFYFWYRGRGTEPVDTGEFPGTGENQFPDEEPETPTILPETEAPRLIRLSEGPVAGGVIGTEGGKPAARFVDRATGRVYRKTFTFEPASRITNTTIAKVYEAKWQLSGGGVVLRYLKEDGETIETLFGAIKKAKTGDESELQASFLPADIQQIALSPDGSELMYIREDNGGGVIYTTRLGGTSRKEVLRTPIREWLLLWPKQSQALIVTKPSVAATGFAATLNPATGSLQTLISGKRGLTVSQGGGSKLLYSEAVGSSFVTRVFDTATRAEETLPLKTLPEKCAWSVKEAAVIYCGVPKTLPQVAYPDAWYQGFISFQDELWRIELLTGNTELIADVSDEAGQDIDFVEPMLSPDEKYLIFTNKNDSILWGYRLGED